MKGKLIRIHLAGALLVCLSIISYGQTHDDELSSTILHKDSIFWEAYNNCDVNRMKTFFTSDLEFYHDKGGITLGVDALAESFTKGVCSQEDNFRLRREEVSGTVHVFPMRKSGVIYGAILTGEHLFYIQEKGKKERADGLAKFSHLWILENGEWKMKRVFSYDHKPAPYINKRVTKQLSQDILKTYTGTYKGAQTGDMLIIQGEGFLIAKTGNKEFSIYPASETSFFMKERDLIFEFIKKGNTVTKVIVRENGEVAEELDYISNQ